MKAQFYQNIYCLSLLILFVATHAHSADLPKNYENNEAISVVDLAGRTLQFKTPPQRVILGESRYIGALAILDTENPITRVSGMLADLKLIDAGTYKQYLKQFPEIDKIPLVGHTSADSFSVEHALSMGAELAIFGVDGHGPTARHAMLIDQLERAGVKVVFVDFRDKPLSNSLKSIELLGKIFAREGRAHAYSIFYKQELAKVIDVLAKLPETYPKPKVFIHSRAGLMDVCCETMVNGMMGKFVEALRGENIASPMIPGVAGILNLEYLLTHQPDVYIATAVGSTGNLQLPAKDRAPYISLGAGINQQQGVESLLYSLSYTGLSELSATKNEKAYAIWHHFYNTPINVVAVQVFAKWLYPELFAELNPEKTMQELFDEFQAIELNGVYWLSVDSKTDLRNGQN